jgi:hypothetical protein
MLTIYFCLDGQAPVVRCWSSAPRIGDTIALPELGGNLDPLKVYDVIWEGFDQPSVSVYVHHAKIEHQVMQTRVPRPSRLDRYLSDNPLQ